LGLQDGDIAMNGVDGDAIGRVFFELMQQSIPFFNDPAGNFLYAHMKPVRHGFNAAQLLRVQAEKGIQMHEAGRQRAGGGIGRRLEVFLSVYRQKAKIERQRPNEKK
jgi:hypothetical protein